MRLTIWSHEPTILMMGARLDLPEVAPVFLPTTPQADSPQPGESKSALFLATVLGGALLFYGLFVLRTAFDFEGTTYFTLIDDAMISMRYADHLAAGHGLVWNIGEDPVQGFSNLGWTLYMALLHLAPVSSSKISLLVMVTSSGVLVANSYLAYCLVKAIDARRETAALIAAGVMSFYYPLVFWSLRGMEVGVAVLAVQAAVLLAVKLGRFPGMTKAVLVGVACFIAVLIRLDLALQVGLIVAYLVSLPQLRRAPVLLAPVAFSALSGVVLVLSFQAWYFDSALPNTYYLKMQGVAPGDRLDVGIQVLIEYASRDFLAIAIVAGVGLILYPAFRTREAWLLAVLFVVQCFYSLYVGGDYAEPLTMPQVDAANRFITQGMPFLIVLFALACDWLVTEVRTGRGAVALADSRSHIWPALAISVLAFAVMSGQPWARWGWTTAPLLKDDIQRAKLGLLIRDSTPPDAVIAAHAAGQIPYFSQRPSIDLLGKSDPVIARSRAVATFRPGHNKWDYDYSIAKLQPDVVADPWGSSVTYLNKRPEYRRLANSVFMRVDSAGLDAERLATKYR